MIPPAGHDDEFDATALRGLAESAAMLGGQMARAAFGRRQVVTLKADASEVTEVDVAVERAVVSHIRATRPDDWFIGEENTAGQQSKFQDPQSKIAWTIDPIDGTRNFVRGVPLFTCSVAALIEGTPVAGAIYDPMADVLYSAARDAGATMCMAGGDAAKLCGLRPGSVRNPTPIVAIPSAWYPASGPFVRRICETSVVRSFGCATLHLTFVATGGIDATFMNNCRLWDIAAGWLIAVESGAVVTRPDGAPLFPVELSSYAGSELPTLAAGSDEHARLLALWRSLRL